MAGLSFDHLSRGIKEDSCFLLRDIKAANFLYDNEAVATIFSTDSEVIVIYKVLHILV